MTALMIKVPVLVVILGAASLVFADELVLSALILATITLSVVSMVIGYSGEEAHARQETEDEVLRNAGVSRSKSPHR